ncbi:MAG: cytosine permease [Paludibacteraceae bacterium]|nr:cytosine permease [Paludibacteraceae bacterium]
MAIDTEYSQSAVRRSSRKSNTNIFMIMLGFTFFSASMWAGQRLAAGLDWTGFIGALLLGGLILSVYTGALGYIAAESGLSLNLLARRSFGDKGSWLPNACIILTQTGWFGIGLSILAIPIAKALFGLEMTPEHTPWQCYMVIAISGALMTASAYFGIKSLTIISTIAVPLIAVLGITAMFLAIKNGDKSLVQAFNSSTNDLGLLGGISIVIGSFVSGGTTTPNFTRFAKSAKVGLWTTVVAFFIGNSLMFIFGAVSSIYVGGNDIFEVMVNLNLFYLAMLSLGLNIWTTNDNTLYSAGLGLANISGLSKKAMVITSGVVGTAAANWLYWNFDYWLGMLSCSLPPIGTVIILSYFFGRKGGRVKQVDWWAMACVVIGAVVANIVLWGIPALNGILATAVCFFIGRKVA